MTFSISSALGALSPRRIGSFLWLQARIFRQCIRLLIENMAFTQAAALAYHTLFGVVPLAIVMLMALQMFPAYRQLGLQLRDWTYEQMNLSALTYPTEQTAPDGQPKKIAVTEKINEIVESYLSKVSAGAITIVGAAFVIWAAIGLLTTIERTFNNIWHIQTGRPFLQRVVYYSWILVFGPILLMLGLFITAEYLLAKGTPTATVLEFVRPVFPFLVAVGLFFFMYAMLPNTRVRTLPALYGAFVAALLWTATKYAFGLYMSKVVMYQAVYGMMGIIPLTVFWIYVMWVIVLFGLQLTYATQNLATLDAAEMARKRRSGACFLANELTIVRMMEYILNAFEQKDEKPVTVEAVCAKLDLPADFAARVLDQMVKAGLLVRTVEPVIGFVPATDGAHIPLSDIYDAIAQVSFAQPQEGQNARCVAVFEKVRQLLAGFTLKDILDPWHQDRLPDYHLPTEARGAKDQANSNTVSRGPDGAS